MKAEGRIDHGARLARIRRPLAQTFRNNGLANASRQIAEVEWRDDQAASAPKLLDRIWETE